MSESIELIQAILGLKPFVLIECNPDPEDETGFTMSVRAGGGVDSNDELACLLLLVVEQITSVDTDLYVQQVDILRRAAGVAPLTASRTSAVEKSTP